MFGGKRGNVLTTYPSHIDTTEKIADETDSYKQGYENRFNNIMINFDFFMQRINWIGDNFGLIRLHFLVK